MSDTRLESWVHHDAQDDRVVVALYADLGTGPAVVFDNGCFTDPQALVGVAEALLSAARRLRLLREQDAS
jgi:hypothetical protein